jgi:hypothetical protein
MLYCVLRMVMPAHRGRMTDDPIVFAAMDRIRQVVILLATEMVALTTFIRKVEQ